MPLPKDAKRPGPAGELGMSTEALLIKAIQGLPAFKKDPIFTLQGSLVHSKAK